ncbi:molybdopterin-dependent oxidoreductase [Dehalobacter sp. DCM]|uniref:molybdopterin-dependent oxidoreductase n=1 Tax=Dehalobacter sp. DCM TaxID=2907827 RepID=UPI0030813999|nr:molybdopterin-dependent oxidoreductase [Dehalobacter sp. DCM]
MAKLHWKENAAPAVTELEDGTKIYRTNAWSPPGCHAVGCGLRIFVKDGELQKVEGDPDQPITKGRLCVRCLTMKEYFYHPDRIKYPMKRVGKRGENKWQRITWDEAYDTIVEKYHECVEKWGVNSVSVFAGTGREACRYHTPLCLGVFGSKTIVHPNSGWSCLVPRQAVMTWILGSAYVDFDYAAGLPLRYDDPNWEPPKYMLIWGRDPLRCNADGMWGHSMVELMKLGTKLITVDPRANWLATRSEYHLQLRPGTDAALALAILDAVIKTDKYDKEFVEKWCYGFDELAERAAQHSPEWAEKITGVPAEDIYAIAECLVQKPSSACVGLAIDQNPNTIQIGHALYSIFAITGNMDIPGGLFMGQPSIFPGRAQDKKSSEIHEEPEEEFEGIGYKEFPAIPLIVNTTHPDCTLDTLETGRPYPIKFAFIQSSNLLASSIVVQPSRWYEAMRKLEFIVASDIFMNPTIAGLADIVLPISTSLEHEGIITRTGASQPGQFSAIVKVMENYGETKSDLEICLDLYHRLHPDSDDPRWKDTDSYLSSDLARINGANVTFPELRERVSGQYELEYRKYEKGLLRPDGEPGFNTITGKIELFSTMLGALDEDPLPYYQEPKFSAVSRPDMAKDYPMTMTTGARRFTSFHSEHRQIKTLREIHPWPTVEINSKTAEAKGITEGSWVYVENPWGRAKLNAHLTPTLIEDVVSMDHGWWYPEKGEEDMFDVWDCNINNLIPNKENGKLGFGTHFKCMPCTIYRAE